MDIENKTIEFRLVGIEKQLAELKDIVLETKMQARDIEELKDKTKEFITAINAHEGRIKKLETQPMQEKANRWSIVTDNFFKIIVGVSFSLLLAKIGLAGGGL